MKIMGGQPFKPLTETEYELVDRPEPGVVILRDVTDGHHEMWFVKNDAPHYSVKIGRWRYEFGGRVEFEDQGGVVAITVGPQ